MTAAVMGQSPAETARSWADAELIRGVVARSPSALAALYDRHGQVCYRVARVVTGDDTFAEDVVQDTFLALWRAPGGYRSDAGSVRGWLVAVAHHKAVDLVRHEAAQQRRQQAHGDRARLAAQGGADPAGEVWLAMRAAAVRDALTALPEAQRQALTLAYFGGLTQREIAQLTGVPLGTVKTRMFTGMRRLAARLADLADPSGGEQR